MAFLGEQCGMTGHGAETPCVGVHASVRHTRNAAGKSAYTSAATVKTKQFDMKTGRVARTASVSIAH